ncbi:MAG: hypothetical protein KBD52_01365 [Candidatus Pacebacteria bacterium]|nr:hypothetical protein [Candidatus Paceibacterota bacterium]
MRILTWNLGLSFFYKYYSFFGLALNGQRVKNEYFQSQYLDFFVSKILEIKADICVLQEFYTKEDANVLVLKLKNVYPYHQSVSTWYHKHSILVLSSTPIESEHLSNSGFFLLETNNFSFVPIHLNSFRALKRLEQVKELLKEIENEEVDCIIGDTNFYNFTENNHSLFLGDKKAYSNLSNLFEDATKSLLYTTILHLNFDKVFLRKDIKFKNTTCLHVGKKGMDHYPVYLDLLL